MSRIKANQERIGKVAAIAAALPYEREGKVYMTEEDTKIDAEAKEIIKGRVEALGGSPMTPNEKEVATKTFEAVTRGIYHIQFIERRDSRRRALYYHVLVPLEAELEKDDVDDEIKSYVSKELEDLRARYEECLQSGSQYPSTVSAWGVGFPKEGMDTSPGVKKAVSVEKEVCKCKK